MTTEKLHHTSEHEEDAPRDMATRFHDSLREEHPRALESLNAAVDAGPDYSKVSWLNPRAGPGEAAAEAREIVLGVREFMADLSAQDKQRASWAAADVMTLPLQRAVKEFRKADPSDGVPEDWGEEISSGESNITQALGDHTYTLESDIVQDPGERWETRLEGLRETARDLELLTSGTLDPHHFSKTLIEKDPALAEKLHNAAQEQEHQRHWPEWMGDGAAERKAELIFDTFQESVQGTSQTFRDKASSDLAYAMTDQLSAAAYATGSPAMVENTTEHHENLQESLARGNLEEFTRNLKQMGRTARMVERHERYGTESPTLRMIDEFREARNTPEKMTAVFNGYVAERDAELAVEPGAKWPEMDRAQEQTVFDTFQEEWRRLSMDGGSMKESLHLARAIVGGEEADIRASDLDPSEKAALEKDRDDATRSIARGLGRNRQEEYQSGMDALREIRERLQGVPANGAD